jgi:hypothetical protein
MEVSVQHFTQLGGGADFYILLFGVVYLAWRYFAMNPTKEQRECNKCCANLGKSATETLAKIRQAFGKKAWAVRECLIGMLGAEQNQVIVKVKAKSRACSTFALASRELFAKNLSWQAKQSITHTSVTFYDDCGKLCEDFTPNLGDKRTGCSITTTHSLTHPFSPRKFWPNTNLLVVLHPPYSPGLALCKFCFPDWKAFILTQLMYSRYSRRRCWTSSQNTAYEMQFKKIAEALGTVHMRGRGLPRGWWWPVGPKLVFFLPDDSTSPINYGYVVPATARRIRLCRTTLSL